jgi:hypothetical protein
MAVRFLGGVVSRAPVQISEGSRKRHALLSQEGSAARRVARGEVPEPNVVGARLWNLLSRDSTASGSRRPPDSGGRDALLKLFERDDTA